MASHGPSGFGPDIRAASTRWPSSARCCSGWRSKSWRDDAVSFGRSPALSSRTSLTRPPTTRRQPPSHEAFAFERLPDTLAARPGQRLAQREQLNALSVALGELTDRQREVFVAIALNDVPSDVLAGRLGTNRNAIYKNLFDARRNLRVSMAAAGHPVREKDAA
jgi:hypothetical protein